MLHFELTEDQKIVRDTVRDFAQTEIAPSSVERDITAEFPTEIAKKLGELGFMGMMTPPEWGGAGMDTISYVLTIEEISKVDASVGVILSVNNSLVCWGIEHYGNDAQKERFLKPLAQGQKLGAFCLSEPEAGSDATQQHTTATRDGDNWILNGTKNWITNGTKADTYLVFAQTDKSKGHKGIDAFLIDWGTEGFTRGKKEDKLGIRSSDTCSLGFVNAVVPDAQRLGKDGEGFKIAMEILNGGRIGIAAQALGIAGGAYEAALSYSKQRKAFGKPISELQVIRFKLADMAVKIEAARALCLRAARLKDMGQKYVKEAAMAKLYTSKIAVEIALEAIQVHGGYGYVREYLVERFLRDSKITEIYEGTSEIQHLVIARELTRG
ncbi:MAG TPA: acyl-CoA dehydrogenase family protein [Candidatus Kapabacteria bacterium]|nr:acyl-CoA dehydrogenase family protein [Candidatus Kapabacteria bacterium]